MPSLLQPLARYSLTLLLWLSLFLSLKVVLWLLIENILEQLSTLLGSFSLVLDFSNVLRFLTNIHPPFGLLSKVCLASVPLLRISDAFLLILSVDLPHFHGLLVLTVGLNHDWGHLDFVLVDNGLVLVQVGVLLSLEWVELGHLLTAHLGMTGNLIRILITSGITPIHAVSLEERRPPGWSVLQLRMEGVVDQ